MNAESIVEKAVAAVLALFVGGAYANWRKEARLVRLEHAVWGTETNDGLSMRQKKTEDTVALIEKRELSHDSLLQRVADDVKEIKEFIRTERGTP